MEILIACLPLEAVDLEWSLVGLGKCRCRLPCGELKPPLRHLTVAPLRRKARTQIPRVVATVAVKKLERGKLGANASGECHLVKTVEIFAEEVGTVLALTEYFSAHVLVGRAVAVGLVGYAQGDTRHAPVAHIVGLDAIDPVEVLDRGVDICDHGIGSVILLLIFVRRIAVVEASRHIYGKHPVAAEMLLQIDRIRPPERAGIMRLPSS